jgi:hypothetical protein
VGQKGFGEAKAAQEDPANTLFKAGAIRDKEEKREGQKAEAKQAV